MTGWEVALLFLNIISCSAILTFLIFVGKFFCVSFCETIYDSWERELPNWVLGFSIISTLVLIISWIGYVNSIAELTAVSLLFSTLFWLCYISFIIIVGIKDLIIPAMKRMHYDIKSRKVY